jgi:hypothetical protein
VATVERCYCFQQERPQHSKQRVPRRP